MPSTGSRSSAAWRLLAATRQVVAVLLVGLLAFPLQAQESSDEVPASSETQEEGDTQEESVAELSQEGSFIDFHRDVWPILEAKCLRCHGPEDAKNDYRVDDSETMLSYLEPGDLESSSLWADYLITDDPDMRMPPPSSDPNEALTGAELATVKLWIEEGASWPEKTEETAEADDTDAAATQALAMRLFSFQGLLHPASVHFPIALLTISGLFVFFSFFNRESCEPVAYHCLWIGALSAIASCVMGWGYAEHEGYGAYTFDFDTSAIDRHRWLGIAGAGIALILIPMARSVRKNGDMGMRVIWMIGSLFLMAAIATTGYQGGELTYGEDHYGQEFIRMFPEWSAEDTAPESSEMESELAPADDETLLEDDTSADESLPEDTADEAAVDENAADENADASTDEETSASETPDDA